MDTNSSLDQMNKIVQDLLLEIKTLKAEVNVLKETLSKTDASLHRLSVETDNDSTRLNRRIDSVERDAGWASRWISNHHCR